MDFMNLAVIGRLVQARRHALGLSQARLAKLGGLSRATVIQLEGGSLVDLGASKLIALLDVVGVDLDAGARHPRGLALQQVSQTSSVSYKNVLDPQVLAAAMMDGGLPAAITPHVATLLDEAPLSLIVETVEEVALTHSMSPKTIWKHLLKWAQEVNSPREVWAL